MTAYVPGSKKALLIPSGSTSRPDSLHLHIILTDVCEDGLHLVGSIASIYEGWQHDETCIISLGEHPFIKRESYFVYRRLTQIRAQHIVNCVDGWVYRKQPPISGSLYNRICNGINVSPFTARGLKAYWIENKPD